VNYFIEKISNFILIGFALIIIFYLLLSFSHKFLPSTDYYNEEFNQAFENRNYQLIALGNSKLLSSIDVNVLNRKLSIKSVNLGYISSDISISKLILESYLDKCTIKPKIVLLEVSWFTFNTNRTFFHPISGDLFLVDHKLFKYFTRYYPSFLHSVKLSSLAQIKSHIMPPTYVDYGYIMKKASSSGIKDYIFDFESFEEIFPTHEAGVNNRLLEDFNSIISVCNRNEIELILYTAPEDEEYSNLQRDRNLIKDIFYSSAKEFDNVFYLDYTQGGKLYKKIYENWLYDSHHINDKELFTNILSDEIKKRIYVADSIK